MKLSTNFAVLTTCIVIFAVTFSTYFTFMGVNKEIYRQANVSQEGKLRTFWELLKVKGNDLHIANGQLMAGGYVINGNHELPDSIKDLFGGTATIFMGDTRIATNVLTAEGIRAVGTKLVGEAYDSVIKQGKPFRGEAQILGAPYFTAYDPIKNSKGEVIGVLYVGTKKSDYFSEIKTIQTNMIIIASLISIIFASITWFLVRKYLSPIVGEISWMTEKINAHTSSIALTMDHQSSFSTQLSSSVVEISSTMTEFSSTASQIASHSQSVVERADKTLEDTKVGAAEVENLNFKINDINTNIQENLEEIVQLGRKSKEINKIMEIINNIANQTKLIAFNAALEAASAGEAGKRFGVVAVEIRRLADNVVESTTEIEGKISEILDSVNRLVMSSEKSSQLIQDGQEYASHTVLMLIESVDGVEETANAARQISLSTQQQQIASSQVVLALKDIERGVRFISDSINQTNGVTDELLELSVQLRKLLSTLQVGKGKGIHENGAMSGTLTTKVKT